jgi:hypothetical protein
MVKKTRHRCKLRKKFAVDLRDTKGTAQRLKWMLPDIQRAGVTYSEFLFGGDVRRPFISAQILEDGDALIRLFRKLPTAGEAGVRLQRATAGRKWWHGLIDPAIIAAGLWILSRRGTRGRLSRTAWVDGPTNETARVAWEST